MCKIPIILWIATGEAGHTGEAGRHGGSGTARGKRDARGTGPILLSQATFLLAHIANHGPVPLSPFPSRFPVAPPAARSASDDRSTAWVTFAMICLAVKRTSRPTAAPTTLPLMLN